MNISNKLDCFYWMTMQGCNQCFHQQLIISNGYQQKNKNIKNNYDMNNNKKTQTTNWIICTGKASNGYQQLNISQKTATTKNINNMKNINKKREKTSATNWIASTCCNICFLSADKHRHCQLIFVFLVSKTMKKSMSNKIDINFEICIGNVLFNT